MGGAPRVPTSRVEHAADGAVVWDGVGHRAHADECVAAILPCVVTAAEVPFGRLGDLYGIEAVIAVLPDVELGAGDRLAAGVADEPANQSWGTARRFGDAFAVPPSRCIWSPEGTEHGGLG